MSCELCAENDSFCEYKDNNKEYCIGFKYKIFSIKGVSYKLIKKEFDKYVLESLLDGSEIRVDSLDKYMNVSDKYYFNELIKRTEKEIVFTSSVIQSTFNKYGFKQYKDECTAQSFFVEWHQRNIWNFDKLIETFDEACGKYLELTGQEHNLWLEYGEQYSKDWYNLYEKIKS